MPRGASHIPTALLRAQCRHDRIDPVGAGALLVAAVGLVAAVMLLKPFAPGWDHLYRGGTFQAHV
jgi:hypothetical protein